LNRGLAHFKDKDFTWMDNVQLTKPKEVIKAIKNAPQPELMRELTGQKIKQHACDIEKLAKWISNIFGKFLPKKTTRTLRKND